jgi:hypothetical protein
MSFAKYEISLENFFTSWEEVGKFLLLIRKFCWIVYSPSRIRLTLFKRQMR